MDEYIINNNNSISSKETFNFFKLKFNRIDKIKRNYYAYLNNIKENIFTNVTKMSYMFYGCSSLISLPDISNWNTSKVTNMSYMFYDCNSLLSLPDISILRMLLV